MLAAPACKVPTVTTAVASGETLRETIRRGHRRPVAERELALRVARRVVHREHGVARVFVEETVGDHLQRAALAFLGGLEDQVQRAREAAVFGKLARRCEQHRGVAVVPARMHHAAFAARVGQAGGLDDRQRVHIGADAQPPGAVAPPQHAHHPGATQAQVYLVAPPAQLFGHQCAGAVFLETELGLAVDVEADGDEFVRLRP